MTEERDRLFDTVIKAVTSLVAIGVAVYGLLQYMEIARNNRSTHQLERAKLAVEHSKLIFELNRQKSDILSRAAQVAADAAWSSDKEERLKAINQFTRLFVGEVSLVADKKVIDTGDRQANDFVEACKTQIESTLGVDRLN